MDVFVDVIVTVLVVAVSVTMLVRGVSIHLHIADAIEDTVPNNVCAACAAGSEGKPETVPSWGLAVAQAALVVDFFVSMVMMVGVLAALGLVIVVAFEYLMGMIVGKVSLAPIRSRF